MDANCATLLTPLLGIFQIMLTALQSDLLERLDSFTVYVGCTGNLIYS